MKTATIDGIVFHDYRHCTKDILGFMLHKDNANLASIYAKGKGIKDYDMLIIKLQNNECAFVKVEDIEYQNKDEYMAFLRGCYELTDVSAEGVKQFHKIFKIGV